LIGEITRSPVLHIAADTYDSGQEPEVQMVGLKEEEIRFLACCNGKQK